MHLAFFCKIIHRYYRNRTIFIIMKGEYKRVSSFQKRWSQAKITSKLVIFMSFASKQHVTTLLEINNLDKITFKTYKTLINQTTRYSIDRDPY